MELRFLLYQKKDTLCLLIKINKNNLHFYNFCDIMVIIINKNGKIMSYGKGNRKRDGKSYAKGVMGLNFERKEDDDVMDAEQLSDEINALNSSIKGLEAEFLRYNTAYNNGLDSLTLEYKNFLKEVQGKQTTYENNLIEYNKKSKWRKRQIDRDGRILEDNIGLLEKRKIKNIYDNWLKMREIVKERNEKKIRLQRLVKMNEELEEVLGPSETSSESPQVPDTTSSKKQSSGFAAAFFKKKNPPKEQEEQTNIKPNLRTLDLSEKASATTNLQKPEQEDSKSAKKLSIPKSQPKIILPEGDSKKSSKEEPRIVVLSKKESEESLKEELEERDNEESLPTTESFSTEKPIKKDKKEPLFELPQSSKFNIEDETPKPNSLNTKKPDFSSDETEDSFETPFSVPETKAEFSSKAVYIKAKRDPIEQDQTESNEPFKKPQEFKPSDPVHIKAPERSREQNQKLKPGESFPRSQSLESLHPVYERNENSQFSNQQTQNQKSESDKPFPRSQSLESLHAVNEKGQNPQYTQPNQQFSNPQNQSNPQFLNPQTQNTPNQSNTQFSNPQNQSNPQFSNPQTQNTPNQSNTQFSNPQNQSNPQFSNPQPQNQPTPIASSTFKKLGEDKQINLIRQTDYVNKTENEKQAKVVKRTIAQDATQLQLKLRDEPVNVNIKFKMRGKDITLKDAFVMLLKQKKDLDLVKKQMNAILSATISKMDGDKRQQLETGFNSRATIDIAAKITKQVLKELNIKDDSKNI
ncbi:MAG: hypothetical protein Ta2D_02150 [Rickettsiales bacterium]|nr:MAG: hypothetical protein Ta2D_02150 [Rickettsiales bacterium]